MFLRLPANYAKGNYASRASDSRVEKKKENTETIDDESERYKIAKNAKGREYTYIYIYIYMYWNDNYTFKHP